MLAMLGINPGPHTCKANFLSLNYIPGPETDDFFSFTLFLYLVVFRLTEQCSGIIFGSAQEIICGTGTELHR